MSDPVAKFISRWSAAQAAERANYQLFLSELCDVLDVQRPDPATDDTAHSAYVFERAVTFHHRGTTKTTTGRIDLYKRDCFVLEAKQYVTPKDEFAELSLAYTDDAPKPVKIARGTAAWDRAMLEALGQAERYARSLPDAEDPPPFLLVVDVGHVIELYSDFTQKGKNYLPFPDSRSHRIRLTDLAQPEIRERLRALAEELDAHRKRAHQQHRLGLTDIYNVLEKLRQVGRGVPAEPPATATVRAAEVVGSNLTNPTNDTEAANGTRTRDSSIPAANHGDATPSSRSPRGEGAPPPLLTTKERAIHDAALVSTLKQLHDDLDRAVADAYGWPWPLTDAEILERVVALNAQRAKEESEGKIRWLRPDYQIPLLAPAKQTALDLADTPDSKSITRKRKRTASTQPSALRTPRPKSPWPKSLADRAKAIETALANAETPQTAQQLAKQFLRANAKDVEEILQTLVALGQAHESDTKGTYVR